MSDVFRPWGDEPFETPDDYRAYWDEALGEARDHAIALSRTSIDTGLTEIEVFDVSFAGANGRRVDGWLRLPKHRTGPLAAVVHFNGYGAGRLADIDDLTWASAGFAQLVMGTHGQRDGSTGHLLEGLDDPRSFYYRGVLTDGARAVDALRSLDEVDANRVAAIGNSQGGGIALGVGALVPDLRAVLAQSPFLTHAPLAVQTAKHGPWDELRGYLTENPHLIERAGRTFAYVDGITSARHASAPGWITAGEIDDICPPETAVAADTAYAAPVTLRTWPNAGHESGGSRDRRGAIEVLRGVFWG